MKAHWLALQVIANEIRVKLNAKSQDIVGLLEMKDKRRVEMLKLMDKLSTSWFFHWLVFAISNGP
jgi:hypothetical protein